MCLECCFIWLQLLYWGFPAWNGKTLQCKPLYKLNLLTQPRRNKSKIWDLTWKMIILTNMCITFALRKTVFIKIHDTCLLYHLNNNNDNNNNNTTTTTTTTNNTNNNNNNHLHDRIRRRFNHVFNSRQDVGPVEVKTFECKHSDVVRRRMYGEILVVYNINLWRHSIVRIVHNHLQKRRQPVCKR